MSSDRNLGARKHLSDSKYARRQRFAQERADLRRNAAEKRQQACAELSVSERIKKLDSLFGKGKGAMRERARLMAAPKRKAA